MDACLKNEILYFNIMLVTLYKTSEKSDTNENRQIYKF